MYKRLHNQTRLYLLLTFLYIEPMHKYCMYEMDVNVTFRDCNIQLKISPPSRHNHHTVTESADGVILAPPPAALTNSNDNPEFPQPPNPQFPVA